MKKFALVAIAVLVIGVFGLLVVSNSSTIFNDVYGYFFKDDDSVTKTWMDQGKSGK